ncbi:MAG: aminotransferase class V-fold PLP-dependent enzyme [Candidatus Acidiferrales bacterium]
METDYRREFSDFEGAAYLNIANQGPLPRVAARAAQAAIDMKRLPHLLPENLYFDLPDAIREKLTRLIGGKSEEFAITAGATSGMCAVAAGMEFQPGDEVIVAEGEFPAHFSTWLPYQLAGKLNMRVIAPRGRFITAADYAEHITPKTRLVSASLVRFDNGALLDAAQVAKVCHAAGAAFLLDITQAAGAVPLSIRALGADFAVCSGYKWLLGPYGTGFFWIAEEWQERLRLGPVYWMAVEGARNFHTLPLTGLKLASGAVRWDSAETASFTNLAAWDASLDFVLQTGVEAVANHNRGLVEEIIERLPRDCCVLASPSDAAGRGAYVCISARKANGNQELFVKLRGEKIYVSLRENALRISPYLYNTREDVARLIKALSA